MLPGWETEDFKFMGLLGEGELIKGVPEKEAGSPSHDMARLPA